ncbi:hypothetical protein DFH06DRAFT_1131908 [Mycena polygramma]|nr:hypothetical protein DFH06DRAFT_1131908 [Mycena polygramma]
MLDLTNKPSFLESATTAQTILTGDSEIPGPRGFHKRLATKRAAGVGARPSAATVSEAGEQSDPKSEACEVTDEGPGEDVAATHGVWRLVKATAAAEMVKDNIGALGKAGEAAAKGKTEHITGHGERVRHPSSARNCGKDFDDRGDKAGERAASSVVHTRIVRIRLAVEVELVNAADQIQRLAGIFKDQCTAAKKRRMRGGRDESRRAEQEGYG